MGEPLARARVGGRRYPSVVRLDERTVLERAIQRVTEQGANADAIVDEAIAAGLDGSDKIVVSTKMLRAEPLSVNAVRTRTGVGCPRLLRVREAASTTSAVSACELAMVAREASTARDPEVGTFT
jgi:hypothetical protein